MQQSFDVTNLILKKINSPKYNFLIISYFGLYEVRALDTISQYKTYSLKLYFCTIETEYPLGKKIEFRFPYCDRGGLRQKFQNSKTMTQFNFIEQEEKRENVWRQLLMKSVFFALKKDPFPIS